MKRFPFPRPLPTAAAAALALALAGLVGTLVPAWLPTPLLPRAAAEPPATGATAAPARWLTDYEQALATARSENKSVLLDFTGSDWCPWCVKLDKEVFSRPEFGRYAHEHLVLVKVDFPRTKPQAAADQARNEALAERFGVEGFPTVVILDPKGKLLGTLGYEPGGPNPFVSKVRALTPAGLAER